MINLFCIDYTNLHIFVLFNQVLLITIRVNGCKKVKHNTENSNLFRHFFFNV